MSQGESPDKRRDALEAASAALRDACQATAIYGDQPPQMYLDALDAVNAALKIPSASEPSESDRKAALAEFEAYFVQNYPGPDTIISNPKWHAPKIFRAAERALKRIPSSFKETSEVEVPYRMTAQFDDETRVIEGTMKVPSSGGLSFDAWFKEWIGDECGVETFDSLRRQRMTYKDLVHAGWNAAIASSAKKGSGDGR